MKTVVGATNARRTCGSDHRKQRKMADLTAAKTILEQLGGEYFVAMTCAKDFVGTEDSLTFKVGSNSNHVSHVRVTQTPGDLYAVTFFRRGKAPQSIGDIAKEHPEHPAHPHSDGNQLASFKFADEGSADSGHLAHPHFDNAKVPGTVMSDAASDQFVFEK